MKLLKVGKIVNTFGIKGELKILSESDFIEDRFKIGQVLYLDNEECLEITAFRMHKGNVLIKVNDHNDINEVEKYKDMDVSINQNELEDLDEGYYLFQLEDLDVYVDDEKVGKVIEVFKPSQTLIRVALEDREILVPFVDAFVKDVNLKENRLHLRLIEGL